MNTLFCINCNTRTPRNFADEAIFNGVYCANCATRLRLPPKPPSSGSSVRKPIDKEVVWLMNLESLKAGAFGDPTSPEALIRYWEAQARANYPHAIQNAFFLEGFL